MNNAQSRRIQPALFILSLSLFWAAAPLRAGVEIKGGGFLQHQGMARDGGASQVRGVESTVKHLRAVFKILPTEAITLQLVPELAGGVFFLDVFGAYKPENPALPMVTLGQFKFPFGQDRMVIPAGYFRTNYSLINKAMFPGHPWDFGAMLTKEYGPLTLQAAAIEGQGPILTLLGPVTLAGRSRQDYSGMAEYRLPGGDWTLGASVYWGRPHASGLAASEWYNGFHLRGTAFKKFLDLQAEIILREIGVYGVMVQPTFGLHDKVKLTLGWDRVEDSTGNYPAMEKTAMTASVNVYPTKKWRSTLEVIGSAAGPDEKPTTTTVVWQNELKF